MHSFLRTSVAAFTTASLGPSSGLLGPATAISIPGSSLMRISWLGVRSDTEEAGLVLPESELLRLESLLVLGRLLPLCEVDLVLDGILRLLLSFR